VIWFGINAKNYILQSEPNFNLGDEDKSPSTVKKILGELKPGPFNGRGALVSDSAGQKEFLRLTKLLDDTQNEYQAEERNQKILDECANSEIVLEQAQLVLSNLNQTLQFYPDRQAEMRVFAIKILTHAANRGEVEALEQAITVVTSEIVDQGSRKGRGADLTDLLEGWLKAVGPERVLSQPDLLFTRFPYKPLLRPYYATALRYVFPDLAMSQRSVSQFTPYLKGDVK
jgi:hypothetical protein